jgi:hypothetical protein
MAGFHKKTLRIAFALLFISLLISIILFLYGTDNWPGTDGLAAETAADAAASAAASKKSMDDAVTASNIWNCEGKFTDSDTKFDDAGGNGVMYDCTVGSEMAEVMGEGLTPTWKCATNKGGAVGDTNYTGCTFVTAAADTAATAATAAAAALDVAQSACTAPNIWYAGTCMTEKDYDIAVAADTWNCTHTFDSTYGEVPYDGEDDVTGCTEDEKLATSVGNKYYTQTWLCSSDETIKYVGCGVATAD